MTDTCRRFDGLIARSAQLTMTEAAALEAHLAGCSSCRELARVLKPVDDVAFAATGVTETMPDNTHANATTARGDHHLPEVTTDRYRITGEVGRGGIGRVLRALDQVLDRPVAVKELFSANDGMRRRFIREALITARLQHPSIVPVYDAGHLGDRSPFYAMKLVAGRPLDQSIAEATTLARRLALLPTVLAVADAMAYAHNERILHRDLKPTNILVGKYGETIVIDWGLAKDLTVDDRDALDVGPYRAAGLDQTVAGAVLGTPAYMAPEQAAGEPVDERADVYALGAILYHVVSGAIPHEGTTLEDMVQRVVSGDVRPLTEREPDVPRDLAAIVSKAMAVEPSARYPNAQGLADELRRFLNGQLVASHSYETRELVRRWVKRHRAAVTVALAALVVVAVVGIVSVMQIVRAKQQADDAAAVATKERNSATSTLAEMLEEQGRQELLAGRPARAAVYLSQAYTQSRDPGIALRSHLADAMRSIEAQRSFAGHHDGLVSAVFSPDGTRIATAGVDHTARVWNAATGTVVATLHGDADHSVSFSPDSARIVTVGNDHTARLWEARTGKLLAKLDAAEDVLSAAFSPGGTKLITTGENGAVKLWEATTAQLLLSFEGHRTDAESAAFSADEARVITASGTDDTAKLWDTKTGKLLLSLEGHHAAISPDGSQIVTVSDTARLWDAWTGKLVVSLDGHRGPIISAAYSPDSSRVVTAGEDHSAKLWDARTGKLLTSLDGHIAEVNAAAFSPDGARVVTASYDHTAKLWDARTGGLLASFEGHRDDVKSVTFSPDGRQVLTASADGTAKLWDARPSRLHASLDAGTGRITSAWFSPDGTRLATTAENDHTAKLWDAGSGKLLVSLDGHRGDVSWAVFDSVGMRVMTGSVDHTVKIWDASTGKLIVSLDDNAHAGAFSPDGARVATAGTDRGARIWNAKTGELIARLDGTDLPHFSLLPDHVYSAAFSSDGERVVTASADSTARIWRADNGNLVTQLDGHLSEVYSAVFRKDGERVVTASSDKTAKVWDARTGKLLASLDGHTDYVNNARFSPDGARIVTASDDQTAKLWDAQTGKLLASFDGHTDIVPYAAFSPDPGGSRVVSSSDDHTVRLWDARTGKLLGSLDGRTAALTEAAFSPDGTRVMTTSSDRAIWIWNVHLEERTPDEIRHIISARDPWALSNGALVPVPAAIENDSHLPDQGGMPPDKGSAAPMPPPRSAAPLSAPAPAPGAVTVTSNDDYTTKGVAMVRHVLDLFNETDCDKLAASIRSFVDANRTQIDALAAWATAHTVDKAALAKAMAPIMRDIQNHRTAFAEVYQKCKHNKAFAAAFDAAKPTLLQ